MPVAFVNVPEPTSSADNEAEDVPNEVPRIPQTVNEETEEVPVLDTDSPTSTSEQRAEAEAEQTATSAPPEES